jgi:deazaflavin-dependent oxidoreductase (nitroreductase family)
MSERLTRGELDERVDLAKGGVVDITTTGRRSGRPRRIEIVFHNIGGRIYISGTPPPRRRNWLANLDARPELTLHLEDLVRLDLPAYARIVEDEPERRRIVAPIARSWRRNDSGLWADEPRPDVETMVRLSPLIEVTLDRAA